MGRIHRYRTALSRHHRSGGFGIHSPFAFNFVLNVLRERRPYYAYDELMRLRSHAAQRAKSLPRHQGVISFKSAKMLFRITNYFQPSSILHVGLNYGVATAATLLPCSRSTSVNHAPQSSRLPVAQEVLQAFEQRITFSPNLADAIDRYAQLAAGIPFIVVSRIDSENDLNTLIPFIDGALQGEAVIIIRIVSGKFLKKLWEHTKNQLQHGHTYTNEKLAVVVSRPALPLQHFLLWF